MRETRRTVGLPFDLLTRAKVRTQRAALALDARVNSGLYDGGRSLGGLYERFAQVMSRFSVTGWRRAAFDLTGEACTLGTGGFLLLLMLAQPAFRQTSDDWLKAQDLAVTFLDRYGSEVGRRGIKHDDSLKLDDFPDTLIKALVSTEDRRFYEHWGIDPVGTFRALAVNARGGGVVQGGSTLTQQLAKNLFLTNERSLERKVNEAFLAFWLESHLTKNEILKLYLDRAYMGGGTFGAAAAADFYFGKSLRDINLAESAMLAGLFKAPTKYAPHVNLPAARARAADVLRNMVEAGYATEGQIQTALRNPATPVTRSRDVTADFYLDWAFDEVKALADDGRIKDRVLVVKTPLDVAVQKRAEQTVETILRQHGDQYEVDQAAMVLTDPDGALRAMVGGRDYGQSQFNRATDAMRQPGSSFKPYVYAAALASGLYKPTTQVVDSPVCIGNWCPHNYGNNFSGSQPMWLAVAKSVNTIPVKISIQLGRALGESHDGRASRLGRAKIRDLAHAMGVTAPLPDTVSMPIGADEVSVIDQAAGFSVFANGGRKAKPYAAAEIRNSQGEVIYRHDRDEPMPQVLSTQVVRDMNFMLAKVVEQGTGRRAALEGFQVAGKSGTTNAYRDAWFVGYTANLVAAVWFGNDDHTSTNNMTGGSLPAMAWHDVMAFAHQSLEPRPLPGLEPERGGGTTRTSAALAAANAAASVPRMPGALSRRSFEVIGSLGSFFKGVEPGTVPSPGGFQPVDRESRRDGASRRDGPAAVVAQGTRTAGGRIETP